MRSRFLRFSAFFIVLSTILCVLTLTSAPHTQAAAKPVQPIAHAITLAPNAACSAAQLTATQRYWFFGNNAYVDFGVNGTSPTAFAGSNMSSFEGATTVTDISGNLLFYSNGTTVFNRTFAVMPNGAGMLGSASADQVVTAFPLPGSTTQYAIVTNSTDSYNPSAHTLYYSIVDMTLDSGNGDVVVAGKNTQLGAILTASEALTAVPNSAGTGFWALTYTNSSPNLLAHQFDSTGYTGTTVTTVLPSNNLSGVGTLYFDPDLNLLALLTTDNFGGNSILKLLSFDRTTGTATQIFEWAGPPAPGTQAYAADFSPSGDYLYVSKIFGTPSMFRYHIAGMVSAAAIKASEELVGPMGPNGGHVRRGPDGRMYGGNNDPSNNALHIVADPDNAVLANVGYTQNGFPLAASSTTGFGLPQTVTACSAATTALSLSHFSAHLTRTQRLRLKWQTATESQVAGFNVWRRVAKDEWQQVNTKFIQAKHPGDVAGAKYRFKDMDIQAGINYRYKLQIYYFDNHFEWSHVVSLKNPR